MTRPPLQHHFTRELRADDHRRGSFLGGYGHVPSQIRTADGCIRILALPRLEEIRAYRCTSTEDRERAITYVRNTKFEESSILHLGRVYREGLALADQVGAVRKDASSGLGVFSPENDCFEERIVEPGATVTITGIYSSEGGGIIPEVKDEMSMVVMLQDAATARRDLLARIRRRVGAALVLVGLVDAAIVYFITHAEP